MKTLAISLVSGALIAGIAVSEVEPLAVSEVEPLAVSPVQPVAVSYVEPQMVSEAAPRMVSSVERLAVSHVDPLAVSQVPRLVVNTADPLACLMDAAARQRIEPSLLQAIVVVESSGRPWAINVNHHGRGRMIHAASFAEAAQVVARLAARGESIDIGLGQVNSSHARRAGLNPVDLLDPCLNLHWAAWVLRDAFDRYGDTWEAVMRYNGHNPAYAWKVKRTWDAIRRAADSAVPSR